MSTFSQLANSFYLLERSAVTKENKRCKDFDLNLESEKRNINVIVRW